METQPNALLSTASDGGAGQLPVDDPIAEPEPEPQPEPAPEPLAASGCDSNYDLCVPIDSDVDCAGGTGNGPSYVTGPVRVVGRDVYRLDGKDQDGIGCER